MPGTGLAGCGQREQVGHGCSLLFCPLCCPSATPAWLGPGGQEEMRGCPSCHCDQIKAPLHWAWERLEGGHCMLGGGGHCMLSSPAPPWGHRAEGALGTHSYGLGVPGEGRWGLGRAVQTLPTPPADPHPLPALPTRVCCASSCCPRLVLPLSSMSLDCVLCPHFGVPQGLDGAEGLCPPPQAEGQG